MIGLLFGPKLTGPNPEPASAKSLSAAVLSPTAGDSGALVSAIDRNDRAGITSLATMAAAFLLVVAVRRWSRVRDQRLFVVSLAALPNWSRRGPPAVAA